MTSPINPMNALPKALSSLTSAFGLGKAQNHQQTSTVGASSFGDFLKNSAKHASQVLRENEKVSMNSASGTSDLILTMTAADNAEVTLQTMIAVRDRTVQAYQEISRMPI